jgi:predicted GNAT superfamily acetyltransferase
LEKYMSRWTISDRYKIQILETPESMNAVEDLQRLVWPGNETEVVPAHMLLAAVHNGGIVIGAFDLMHTETQTSEDKNTADENSAKGALLVGFVFGFPGIYPTPDGPRLKHSSHMLGVHPNYRDQGIGFALKRAQWQMVRHQGLDRITWTFDPLMSRNAHLNITRLGAVCNTYKQEVYGVMRDGLNVGIPSDRFQVDWWVNTRRVSQRLNKKPRIKLDMAHFLAADTAVINPTQIGIDGFPYPTEINDPANLIEKELDQQENSILMVEIPADITAIKNTIPELAIEWRLHTREIFEQLFQLGYLVTDFVHLPGKRQRSFYILSHGEATL